jgi:hypothetical protein
MKKQAGGLSIPMRLFMPNSSTTKQPVPWLLACAFIFAVALSTRLLYWQNWRDESMHKDRLNHALVHMYKREARQILSGGGILFRAADSGDARMLVHPPGYPILLAAIYLVLGESLGALQALQVISDALAAVVIFLIAAELLPLTAAFISGLLVALSPHLAYYSLWLSPDTLAVLPLLLAIYLFLRASKQPKIITVMAAGALIGLSCWLRANALLLAPMLAATSVLLFERGKRLHYSAALVGATLVVILPITIRNLAVFHRFIPLSLPFGINLIQGIAEYDKEGRFGMPVNDREAARKDAEWHGRPEYADNPWVPDGIERDRARLARGLEIIRAHPGWFLKVMLRRAAFMLSYNDSQPRDWPFYTATVPLIAREPAFNHQPAVPDQAKPAWASDAAELITRGERGSPQVQVSLTTDGRVQIIADASGYLNLFCSELVAVRKNTDYLLTLSALLRQGNMAIKVTNADKRITLASAILSEQDAATEPSEPSTQPRLIRAQLPFASGNTDQVRLSVSNNHAGINSIIEIERAEVFELGPTPYAWTRYPRLLIRGIQKNLFTTAVMLPLVLAGVFILLLAGRPRAASILLVVPIYYLCSHSAFSTEYRYILAMHYFLLTFAAAAIYFTSRAVTFALIRGGSLLRQASRSEDASQSS